MTSTKGSEASLLRLSDERFFPAPRCAQNDNRHVPHSIARLCSTISTLETSGKRSGCSMDSTAKSISRSGQ